MTTEKERICLSSLDAICKRFFDEDEFSLSGAKESAVCLEKVMNQWSVYESEKNSRNDTSLFDNIVEAGLDFLSRLSPVAEYSKMKNLFLESIIGQKTA